jgi:hypothetical protein
MVFIDKEVIRYCWSVVSSKNNFHSKLIDNLFTIDLILLTLTIDINNLITTALNLLTIVLQ